MDDTARTVKLVDESLASNMANHVVESLRSDGLYRHWRCQSPGTRNFGFDIVTWPGFLCFTGDLGDFLFSRERDMIPFMSAVCRSEPIDYRYAAEKCLASRGSLTAFSQRRFKAELAEVAREHHRRDREGALAAVAVKPTWLASVDEPTPLEKIRAIRDEWEEYRDPSGAIRAMHESGLWDGCDVPLCRTWDFQFVRCVRAIRWFILKLQDGSAAT